MSLPVDEILPELRAALSRGHAVLASPPGSGKTTRAPLALLEEPWLQGRKILLLEPRRPAVRMAARYMAGQLNEPVGKRVGYRMRLERRVSRDTRLEVITEGLLVRMLQDDPELTGVGLVIFDEFHEQSLASELGLALCLDVCSSLREDLRLLVMSATLDEQQVAGLIGGPAVVSDGNLHPVTIHHLPRSAGRDPLAATLGLVRQAVSEQEGDLLVFLPGKGEIRRFREELADLADRVDLLPLHGEMDAAEQARVLLPPAKRRRRVVLATDVAETSLTIEGISTVVDSGLARKPAFDPNSGLERLELRAIGRASARQRAGRAGRLGPGVCYRAWTETEHRSRPFQHPAEILQSDLAPLALELALWGVKDPDRLRWLNPPPRAALEQGRALLQRLQALDSAGRITRHGRAMAATGLHPRLAHLLLRGGPGNRAAADLAALLSERDPWRAQPGECPPADLGLRLLALEEMRAGNRPDHRFDRQTLRRILHLSDRLMIGGKAARPSQQRLSPAALLSLGWPDRIAGLRPGSRDRYHTTAGRGAVLEREDALAGTPLLAVARMDAGSRDGRIWLALPLEREALVEAHGQRLEEEDLLYWDDQARAVRARRVTRLEALELERREQPVTPGAEVTRLLLDAIREGGLATLPLSKSARTLLLRARLARQADPDGDWPDLEEATLLATLDSWLLPWMNGITSLEQLQRLDWMAVLGGLLDWPQRQLLERQLPERWALADGSTAAIDYSRSPPVLAAPLQLFYGSDRSPALMDGRLPLKLELLSPAGRPVQVTTDLAHFWKHGWQEVRKELRGRYPKHHWPEDPARARPVKLKRNL